MKRRLLAILLSLTLMLSLVPTAWAEEAESGDQPILQSDEAQSTEGNNADVQAELTAAGGELTSGTYTLSEDLALTDANLTIPVDSVVVLDLNGHTLTGTGTGSVIRVAGTLTIQDSRTGGKITGGNKNQTKWTNDNDHNGGALFIDTNGKVYLNGGALSGNQAWNGGGVYINAGGYLEMNGGAVSDNKSLRDYNGGGGGVYALAGTAGTAKFVMNNGVIENNTTLTQGGGAFISGEMEMNGGVIRNNHAMIGGGVCINGTMTMTDGSIVGNQAEYLEGSNYYQIQAGGIKVNGGTLNLLGGTVSGNTATSTKNKNASNQDIADAIGGGIYSIGTLNVSGAPVVEKNETDDKPQNVYLDAGRTIALSGDLTADAKLPATVTSRVGRITTANGYTIPEDVVTSDEGLPVKVRAGDIYFTEAVLEAEAVCSIIVDRETIYYKTLSAAVASLPSDDNVVTLLKDCELTSSVGITSGVRVTLTSKKPVSITWPEATTAFFVVSPGAELTVKGQITVQGPDKDVAGNTVGTNSSLNAFNVTGTLNIGEAGAADAESPKVQGFNTATTTTAGNTLAKSSTGGAVYVRSGGTVNLYSGVLCNNTSIIGGAIYAYDKGTTVNLYGGEISQNVACNGAGVAVRSEASVHVFGSKISNNKAARRIGGKEYTIQGYSTGAGMYLDQSAELTMTGGNIIGNTAENGIGGGIYIASHSHGEMSGGEISGNQTTTAITDEWSGNQARGGGVYISNASFTLTDGEIKGNACVKPEDAQSNSGPAGGGVCVSGSANTPGQFTMTGGSITGNKCANRGGGVYITAYGTTKLTGGSISGNTAAAGSGVYLAVSTEGGEVLEMEGNPSVIGNTADNVYLDSGIRGDKVTHVDQVITLTGAMTPGANVGVTRAGSSTVVAEAGSGYAVTDQDAAYFTVDNGTKLIQKAESKNQLILADKETGKQYYKITLKLSDHIKADRALKSEVAADTGCTIKFTPDEGYQVDTISVSGSATTSQDSVTMSNIAADTTITVTEKALPVNVTESTREINGVYGTPMDAPLKVTATYSANSIIKSYALENGSSLPKGLTLSADGIVSGTPAETTTDAGQTATVIVTANNGTTAKITLTVKIAKATPEINIAADKTDLTGSGTVTLTVTKVPTDAVVKVTCDDSSVEVKDNNDGTYTVALPNTTKTYKFKAALAESANYTAADSTCTVSVTRHSSSTGGSSSSSTSNSVTVSSTKNGDVTVSPKNASKGTTVTITVDPDKGYELDTITVKDANGKTVKLTDKGNGKYTFTMPASKVTVSAEFAEIQTASTFADVPADAYYAKAVEWAVKNGITNGKGNGLFGSNDPCTRGQIVTFLWRAAGSPTPKGTAVVPADVVPGSYCYDAVAWALENGITNGLADGTFGVNNTCTRGQSVTFLYRAVGKAPSAISGFTDVAADSFCTDAVAWAVENGVTNGTSATTFSPNNGCTRAQIVTFLYRAYQGK